jgi:hypothetical protein
MRILDCTLATEPLASRESTLGTQTLAGAAIERLEPRQSRRQALSKAHSQPDSRIPSKFIIGRVPPWQT